MSLIDNTTRRVYVFARVRKELHVGLALAHTPEDAEMLSNAAFDAGFDPGPIEAVNLPSCMSATEITTWLDRVADGRMHDQRYTMVSTQVARERGLTRDCVRIPGDGFHYHERAGVCWGDWIVVVDGERLRDSYGALVMRRSRDRVLVIPRGQIDSTLQDLAPRWVDQTHTMTPEVAREVAAR
jgi:hypothetical protein